MTCSIILLIMKRQTRQRIRNNKLNKLRTFRKTLSKKTLKNVNNPFYRIFFSLFLNYLFRCFIFNGEKRRAYLFFGKIFAFLKNKLKIHMAVFLRKFFCNLVTGLSFKIKHLGKIKYLLPWSYAFDKSMTKFLKVSVIWFKKALKLRTEKKFLFKFYSEMIDISNGKGYTLRQKKLFYYNFYKTRTFMRFLRFLKIFND